MKKYKHYAAHKHVGRFSCRQTQTFMEFLGCFSIAVAIGYAIFHDGNSLHFFRVTEGMSHLKTSDVLLTQKIPDNARIELETSMAYVIKKYGL